MSAEHEAAPRPLRGRVWIASIVLWGGVALFATTHQWADLRATGKALSWWRALGWQGASWLLLALATPALFTLVARAPLERRHTRRAVLHAVASLVFGVLFLAVAVPVRLAFHPSGVRLNLFGEAFYKSAPQFIALGALAYWAVVLVASLVETRARLGAALELLPDRRDEPTPPLTQRLTLPTPAGALCLHPDEIAWAEPSSSGAVLHTANGSALVRHSLTRLETQLAPHGFVRCHRACLVNAAKIREVLGGASRDGEIVLDTGDRLPVSRRRRAALDAAMSAPLGPEPAPLAKIPPSRPT